MRLNILLDDPGGARSGYANVDPFAPEGDRDRFKCDVSNLDAVVDNGEAVEIVAHDILDYFGVGKIDEILDHWVSKLAYGGRLSLSVVDVREVARGLLAESLPFNDASILIYGAQQRAWDFRRSMFTVARLAEVLENKGFNVLKKRIENFRAVVTCERPKKGGPR